MQDRLKLFCSDNAAGWSEPLELEQRQLQIDRLERNQVHLLCDQTDTGGIAHSYRTY